MKGAGDRTRRDRTVEVAVTSRLDARKMVVVVETSAVSKVSAVKTLGLAFEHEKRTCNAFKQSHMTPII